VLADVRRRCEAKLGDLVARGIRRWTGSAATVLARTTMDPLRSYASSTLGSHDLCHVVLAELIHWSLRARTFERNEAGMSGRRLVDLGVLWLSSFAAGSIVMAVADVGNPAGFGLTVAGVGAAAGTLGLVLTLTSRPGKLVSNDGNRS
jgi:hypothetical protein